VKAGAAGLNPVPLQKLHRNWAYAATAITTTATLNAIFFIMIASPYLRLTPLPPLNTPPENPALFVPFDFTKRILNVFSERTFRDALSRQTFSDHHPDRPRQHLSLIPIIASFLLRERRFLTEQEISG
jgi:hypothetical protein